MSLRVVAFSILALCAGAVPLAAQTLTTVASPSVPVGAPIFDTATLAGFTDPTGSLTFSLYGPDNPSCSGAAIFTSVVAVAGNGTYPSATFNPTAPGTYLWIAGYSGDLNNPSVTTACGDPTETVVVTQASPTLTTVASPDVVIGGSVSDTATLAGGFNPTGNIAFALFGPGDPTCSGVPVFTAIVPVSGNGDYPSGSFTPTALGTYNWVAAYSGDTNNAAAASPCGSLNESVDVTQATPTLTTTASGSVVVGGNVSDSAALAGGVNPTGTITFNLFGPNDPTCAGSAVFSATVPVSGNGAYGSGNFAPATAGTYNWTAAYSGDTNNAAAASPCGAANESVDVTQATPTLTTTASGSVVLGGNVSDSAALAGGVGPTGTITFNLYGPGDPTCAGASVFSATVPVSGNGNYGSGDFAPSAPGTYNWTASYSGDTNNASAASPCGAANESVDVTPATPTLTTTASPNVSIGGSVSDSGLLAGGINPTGTITFDLYGPNDPTCAGASVFNSVIPVAGNGTYGSGSFTPTAAGTYNFVAVYSGDANNASATSPCGAANESVVVGLAAPTLTTTASASVAIGGSVSDTATLAGGSTPTGSITFNLYGPDNATCSGSPAFTSSVSVNGNGAYPSPAFTPATAGTYRWTASYSGDANNGSANSPCNAPGESVVVSQAAPTLTTVASGNVSLGGSVSDTGTLAGGYSPTGSIVFSLFGPDDATCAGPAAFTASIPVSGNGAYGSGSFTPVAAGTYRWTAVYGGDANNAAAASPCNAPNETVVVGTDTAQLTIDASPSGPVGTPVSATATLSGGTNPTGTITFSLYGPGDASCSGTPIFTSTATVNGNGTYSSGSFSPTTAGTYRWVASYSGDASNAAVSTACSDPAGVVTLAAAVAIPLLDPLGLGLLTLALAIAGMVALKGLK